MRNKWIIGMLIAVALFACRREFKTPSWETNVNAALIYSDMGIEDLIPDSLLSVNPDNSINLVYDAKLFSYGIDSVLGLADSTIKDSFISPFSSYAGPGITLYTNIESNQLNLDGPELTKVNLKQGFIDYKIRSNVQDTTIITYTITSGTIGGAPIEITATVPPSSSSTSFVTVTGTANVSGASLDLTGPLNNSFNEYETKLVIKTAPGTTGVSISALIHKVVLEVNYRDMIPSYVKGYFGNLSYNTPLESETFSFLESLNEMTLDLSQVNTTLYITNGMGADARFKIDTLMAYKSSNGSSVLLNHPVIGNNVNINRALDMGWYAQSYEYTADINSSNSNIESFIELIPDVIKYKLGVELNPLGNVSMHSDFIYENSRVEAGMKIDIPLSIIASKLKLSDTVDFDLDKFDLNGKILKGRMRFNVVNGLPLKATFRVQMLDENSMVIGNLVSSTIIEGNTGSTASSPGTDKYQTIYVDLDENNITTAYRAKKLVIYTEFETTPSSTFVTLYNTQRFKTQISVLADYLTSE